MDKLAAFEASGRIIPLSVSGFELEEEKYIAVEKEHKAKEIRTSCLATTRLVIIEYR